MTTHHAAIGQTNDIEKITSSVLVGRTLVSASGGYVGKLNGPEQFASDGDKLLMAMIFPAEQYPYEKFGYDGKNLSFALHKYAPSSLSDFLRANKTILKHGLFGGVLNTSWPKMQQMKNVELSLDGETKIGDARYLKIKFFAPDIGNLKVTILLDPVSFAHVGTDYTFIRSGLMTYSPTGNPSPRSAAPTYTTLTERFSNFANVEGLTLPLKYKIAISSSSSHDSMTWEIDFDEVYNNEKLDPSVFKFS